MEHIHNCGNCAHFEACDSIMKRYAGLSGIAKDGPACGNYAVRMEAILGDDYDLNRLWELLEACKGLEPSEIAESKLLIATRKDPEKLARMAELVEADRDGRCVVLPCHIGDPVFMGTGRSKITGYEEDVCDGFYIGRNGVLQVKAQNHKGNHGTYGVIGQTAELTHEAAEAALKGDQHGQDL